MGYNEDYFREYAYEYAGPSEGEVAGMILMIYLVLLLVILLVALAGYLIKAFGMYRMAQREGQDYPWLAFVPFARYYLQGELSGDIEFKKRSIRNPGVWLIVLPIMKNVIFGVLGVVIWGLTAGVALAMGISGGGFGGAAVLVILLLVLFCLLAVAYEAGYKSLRVLVDYRIFRKFTTNHTAIVHAILSVTIPLYEAICLLVYRNKPYNPGMEPDVMDDTPQVIPPIMPLDGGAGSRPVYTERPVSRGTAENDRPAENAGAVPPVAEMAETAESVENLENGSGVGNPAQEPVQESSQQSVQESAQQSAQADAQQFRRQEDARPRVPYVYRDSVELTSEEPEGYDTSKPEE